MAVGSPTSLANIVAEFGEGIASTDTYNSGSGSVTAPANASGVRIKLWGGGGGGGGGGEVASGGGGGGGGFVIKTMSVTGGSTSFDYSVGTGGTGGSYDAAGTNGTSSTITGGATLTAGGGGRGFGSDVTPNNRGSGGTTSGGDTGSEAGSVGSNGNGLGGDSSGGNAGGQAYGGGTGGDNTPNAGTAPGGGGGGAFDGGGANGANGRVIFEWLFKGLSTYARGTGEVPSHSANANIPTSTTNLAISQFSGAEKSFTATITSADISGVQDPPTSYATRGFDATNGSINRAQVGLSRNNTNTTTLISWIETPGYDYFLNAWNFTSELVFSGDVRSSTLGYHFFTAAEFATQSYNGTNTTFTLLPTFTQTFGANGSNTTVELVYGGP